MSAICEKDGSFLMADGSCPLCKARENELVDWAKGVDFQMPNPTWQWYVFGGRGTPVPIWHRILTHIVLRSQWERIP